MGNENEEKLSDERLREVQTELTRDCVAGDIRADFKTLADFKRPVLNLMGYACRTVLKARAINLDTGIVGSFSEIGAGVAISQVFILAGHASQTIVEQKSMYAQQASDWDYNQGIPLKSHVTEDKLGRMLDRDHASAAQRQRAEAVGGAVIFTIADTVATHPSGGRGWLGLRFQTKDERGKVDENEVVSHVRMLNPDTYEQQRLLGTFGVNLIFACYQYRDNPARFFASLMDDIPDNEFSIEEIRLRGEALSGLER